MEKLVQQFRDIQPTLRKNEVWRFADFSALLTDDLQISHGERQTAEYHCNIPDLDTLRLVVENGYCHMSLLQTEQGMVVAGLRDICGSRPDFVRQFFGTCTPLPNPYLQLNSDNYSFLTVSMFSNPSSSNLSSTPGTVYSSKCATS